MLAWCKFSAKTADFRIQRTLQTHTLDDSVYVVLYPSNKKIIKNTTIVRFCGWSTIQPNRYHNEISSNPKYTNTLHVYLLITESFCDWECTTLKKIGQCVAKLFCPLVIIAIITGNRSNKANFISSV